MSISTALQQPASTFSVNGFSVAVYTKITDQAKAFENTLSTGTRVHPLQEEGIVEKIQIPLTQQTIWLENTTQPFVLLQLSTAEGMPAGQISAQLYRPRRMPMFGYAFVQQLGCSFSSHEVELASYEALKKHLLTIPSTCTLRIQALRANQRDLLDFESISRRAGFAISDPMGVTRTLIYDLAGTPDELLASLDKKTRAKVRHASRDKVEIRPLTEDADIASLQNALDASFGRSQGTQGYLDFNVYMRMAKQHPDHVLILGLFLKSRPSDLMAYLINVRHPTHVEAVSAGSVSDPELRKLPFNYFLFWDRVSWAKQHSDTFLDLGGVTDGGSTDPLAGISAFKRHFTKKEIEIGREMTITLRPYKNLVFKFLKKLFS